jgi:predicted transcriptional regulator
MGATKTDHFTDKQIRIAVIAKALGHPARIAIIEYLMKVNECICGDIVNEIPLAQPTVSQHLKELKEAGLIQGEITGVKTCYCINETNWKKIGKLFDGLFTTTYKAKSCC